MPKMAKIICVLYDDPVDGYPKSYPRDNLPKIDQYPGGQTLPTRRRPISNPARCLAASQVS
jgi:formate dehydrogenase